MRNDPQRGFAHDLPRALVLGECVIKGDFLIREARFLAARSCRPDVLGKLDQFFEHLSSGEGVGVIARNGRFQPLQWLTGADVQAALTAAAVPGPAMTPGVPGIGLELLLPEYEARMAGLARNVEERRITMLMALAEAR